MKDLLKISLTILVFIIIGCNGAELNRSDFVGNWNNPDGTILRLNSNGTFSMNNFKPALVFVPTKKYIGKVFSGSGNWQLKKEESQWVIFIDFLKVDNSGFLCSFSFIISGKGILDNQPPWNFFLWVNGEGEDRFELHKAI